MCVRKRDCGVFGRMLAAPQQWVQVETFTSSVSNSSLNCIYQIKRALHTLETLQLEVIGVCDSSPNRVYLQ